MYEKVRPLLRLEKQSQRDKVVAFQPGAFYLSLNLVLNLVDIVNRTFLSVLKWFIKKKKIAFTVCGIYVISILSQRVAITLTAMSKFKRVRLNGALVDLNVGLFKNE